MSEGAAAARVRASRPTVRASPQVHRAAVAHALAIGLATPAALLAVGGWIAWRGFALTDALLLLLSHLIGACGVSVGAHRYFAHRAFEVSRPLRTTLAIWTMTAAQGPLIYWVSNHRLHHRFADRPGDPHSPNCGSGPLRGLWRAHLGWMYSSEIPNPHLFARDLLGDPWIVAVNRLYPAWVLLGLLAPMAIGGLVGGPVEAVRWLVWAGVVRLATVHHATFAVNSIAHRIGTRRHDTPDESRNVAALALLSCGETWHNNHHAHPASARFGNRWYEIDLGYLVIGLMARLRLAWNVRIAAADTSADGPPATTLQGDAP